MGNVTQCMGAKLSARVIRPDGYIVEYNYGIRVAMLMTLFPGYLVIHCSTDPVHPGERRQFKVMEITDHVQLGQSYIIYPIPPQFKETFKAPPIRTEGLSGSRYLDLRLSLRIFIKSKKVKRMRSRFWKLKLIARSFLSLFAFRPSSVPGKVMSDGEGVPLMNMYGTDHSFISAYGDRTREKKMPSCTGDLCVWKPDLDDIPEDPRAYNQLPKCAYGKDLQFKSPSSDRLLQPRIDQGLGPRIGKVTTTMSSTVGNTDFNRGFSKQHAWDLHPGFEVTPV